MRASDGVDAALEILPRPLVRTIIMILIACTIIFDWREPFMWYVQDKAAGFAEIYNGVLQGITDSQTATAY